MTAKTARTTDRRAAKPGEKPARREHDMVTLGIAFAAIILFVGTAGVVLPNLIDAWQGEAASLDAALTNALLLNIALILLGWHRYKALTEELKSRRASEEEARRLADIDHLTGCYNRRSFTAALGDLLTHLERREQALAAIAVDLDNFKQVNDLHGHPVGDIVIRVTAERLRHSCRHGDTVSRLGGDEFAIITEKIDQTDEARNERLERLRQIIFRPIFAGDRELQINLKPGTIFF